MALINSPLKVQDIRSQFVELLKNEDFTIDKSGVKTVEIINATFIADESIIFGNLNFDYVNREIEWYKSQSLNVNDIPGETPQIWKQVSSKDGFVNSNYGWAVWSHLNFSQFDNCKKQLQANPDSRRAIMIYTRPDMQVQYNAQGMSDFMCCIAVQYFIKNNTLYPIVFFRSMDAIFGYKNDHQWMRYISQELHSQLRHETYAELDIGEVRYNVGSLHIYERHFDLIK
ncbi:MAG: thymidylate synthase [Candidatus Nitrosotenuis sp.]